MSLLTVGESGGATEEPVVKLFQTPKQVWKWLRFSIFELVLHEVLAGSPNCWSCRLCNQDTPSRPSRFLLCYLGIGLDRSMEPESRKQIQDWEILAMRAESQNIKSFVVGTWDKRESKWVGTSVRRQASSFQGTAAELWKSGDRYMGKN